MEPLKKNITCSSHKIFCIYCIFIKYLVRADYWCWHKPVCLCVYKEPTSDQSLQTRTTHLLQLLLHARSTIRARLRRCVCVGMRTVSEQVHDTHPAAVVVTVSKTPMKHTSSSSWATENRPPDGECQSRASRRTRPLVVEVV